MRLDEAEARIVGNEERLQNAEEAIAEMLKLEEQLQSKLLRENLDIPDTKDLQIDRAHWALAPQRRASAQPISILVRFLGFRMKEEVLRLAWQKKGFTWKNC